MLHEVRYERLRVGFNFNVYLCYSVDSYFITIFCMAVVVVTDESFEKEVNQSALPVIVDFFAVWCGPCKMMSPVIDELAEAHEGVIKFCKIDVDESPASAGKFSVMSIPTLAFIKGGKLVDTVVGFQSKDKLEQKVKAFIA